MGLYQYTLRKDMREVRGMKIARFGFAYKMGRDWQPGGETSQYRNGKNIKNRTVLRFEAQAKKARSQMPDVKYAVVTGNFNAARYPEGIPVYDVGDLTQFTEELPSRMRVGTLRRVNGRFIFEPQTPAPLSH